MPLHLVKLCVGAESVDDLSRWIHERAADKLRRGLAPEHVHRTRMSPKRADELLDEGSLYWVIKGEIKVRESIRDLRAVKDENGISHCDIVLSGELVPVEPRRLRPFQGWRYLSAHEAPRDLRQFGGGAADLPEDMIRELAVLGLL